VALARRDTTLDLALNHHRNVRGEAMQFEDFFYMLDILADPSPYKVIKSAVQTGKTEGFICSALADCLCGLGVFYVLPTQDTRNIFVPNRIDRCISQVPLYQHMKHTSIGSADSVLLKHLGRGTIRFGASHAMVEFKEFPADVVYVDEFDQCEPTGVAFAMDRTKGSPYRFRTVLGNPTLAGNESRHNLDWEFQHSDAKKMHYRCHECGLLQPLDWWQNVARPVYSGSVISDYEPRLKVNDKVEACCLKCGAMIDRVRDVTGWRPTGDPLSPVSGYHISRMNSLLDDIDGLWFSFRKAVGNELATQVFVNSDLGECYEGGTGNRLNERLLGECVDQYLLPAPGTVRGPCTMGIDVGSTLDVRISDFVVDDTGRVRRRLVYCGKLRTVEEAIEVGKNYRVAVAVIDAMPEQRLSLDFQARAPFRVWRCQYKASEGKNVKSLTWNSNEANGEQRYVTVDRTEAMDHVFQAYVRRDVIEPPNFGGLLDGRYVTELTSPVRAQDGDGRYYWIKSVDHQFHAHVYDWIAGQDPLGGFFANPESILRGQPMQKPAADDFGVSRVVTRMKRAKRSLWDEVTG
jgi:hypothetical protein